MAICWVHLGINIVWLAIFGSPDLAYRIGLAWRSVFSGS
jgi:hypothetical protein